MSILKSVIKKPLLTQEQQKTPLVSALLITTAITGLITWPLFADSPFVQAMILVHCLAGLFLTIGLPVYLWLHVKRTLGIRRADLMLGGFLILSILVYVVFSGWQLLIEGQQEAHRLVLFLHQYASVAFLTGLILHIVNHRLTLPAKRKSNEPFRFPSYSPNTPRYLLFATVSSIVLLLAIIGLNHLTHKPLSNESVVGDYSYSYGPHPFRPSQTETYHGGFIDLREIDASNDCASCHADVAEQWQASAHKKAASDPTYVTNVSLLANKKGIEATRYCEGCHAPVALLTGMLTPGGDHGGIEGSRGNVEGVNCLSCHAIDKVVHLKGVASYSYRTPSPYLFEYSDRAWLTPLRHLLIRVSPAQHRQEMSRDILKDPKICATCHTQFMDKDMNNWGWVKMQDEYGAWLESPYSGQSDQTFAQEQTIRCHDCHMPLEPADDPSADDSGQVRSHRNYGANTMLAVQSGDTKHLLGTKQFLQANKIRLHIEEPRRQDATYSSKPIDEQLRTKTETPYYFYLNEDVELKINVSNVGVGHNFPGGTLDINEAWLAIHIADANNETIFNSGELQENGHVDPNAYFYRSLPIDPQGKLVWKHDLFNRVGETYKNFVPAGKTDLVTYAFQVPAWAKSPLTATAVLKYRKLNERYARWALKEKYLQIPVIDMARDTLVIPVKIQKEVR